MRRGWLVVAAPPRTVAIALAQSLENFEALQHSVEAAGGFSGPFGPPRRVSPFQLLELLALVFDFLLHGADELVEVTAHVAILRADVTRNAQRHI
jgi:hypothetical protein